MRILLVEDNEELIKVLHKMLVAHDYVVDVVSSVKLAKLAVADTRYEIVILDRMLPDGDGLELIAFCKKNHLKHRFVVLSALNELGKKIEGLEQGADDYIAKPFEPEELLVRLRVALRHPLPSGQDVISAGNINYRTVSRDFDVNGMPLVLPRRELLVLELLLRRLNRVVSREALEESMYSFDDEILSNTLESHISKLRKNLQKYNTGLSIHTIRGVGYLLKEES